MLTKETTVPQKSNPINIYVGSAPSHRLIAEVFRHSVEKNTAADVVVQPIHEVALPFEVPDSRKNRAGTAFSFQRFMIPQLSNYKGRAIYCDSDQILFDDMEELFTMDMKDASAMYCHTGGWRDNNHPQQTSVMLLNCEQLDWHINEIVADLNAGKYNYQELMWKLCIADKVNWLPARWNHLDKYNRRTALLHYTNKKTQPWINNNHKLGHLWFNYLFSGLDEGNIDYSVVIEALENRWVRPSLKYQVDNRISEVRKLPRSIKKADEPFIAFCAKHKFNNTPGDYH